MTQVTLHIDNKKKCKAVLEAMEIAYDIQGHSYEMSEAEKKLLKLAEADLAEERVYPYHSHQDILGR